MKTWHMKKKHEFVVKQNDVWYDIIEVATDERVVSCKDYGSAKAWFIKLNGYGGNQND